MALSLWPHQCAALDAIQTAISGGRMSALISMPTGTGKTRMFCVLAKDLGWPTIILVHRDELIRQTVSTLGDVWPGAVVGVVRAEQNEWERTTEGVTPDVVIASVQSLHERRLHQIPPGTFALVIVDECHHAPARTWTAAIEHLAARFTLGVSATPSRCDGKGLAELFGERPLYSYGLRQAIEDNRLVRITQFAIDTTVDLDGVSYRAGDFATGELSSMVNTEARNRVIIEAYEKHAADRRALAFCVDRAHARDLAEAFCKSNIDADVVTGDMPLDKRRATLERFAAGDIRVLTNCMVLTEGFDDRGIDCILMTRPTCSTPLYMQTIGRGLRLAPDKTNCLILDFVDASRQHKLITVLDLLGAPKLSNANGQDVIRVADADRAEAERQLLIASTRPLKWRLTHVCPWPDLPNLNGYTKEKPWHDAPASPKQVKYLHSVGVESARALTKGESSYLISRVMEYEAAFPTPATSKQRYCLERAGLWRADLTKRTASELIGKLKSGALVGAA
ncbi:MAG: DEAD/DEAH box helicase [Planctomycetes bacterium]|nr:DEAD/DEAH box helicase [Planctomycetota bacterium]